MVKVHACRDLEKCRELWERLWPRECLFDLWDVRACFAGNYDHPPEFLVSMEDGEAVGLLPLSWVEEKGRYSFFPGELWQGKTWLEQNRILARRPAAVAALLEGVTRPAHLRYLLPGPYSTGGQNGCVLDETGYLFTPARYGYSFARYLEGFSHRSRKKLHRELDPIETRGVRYRFDDFSDMETLFRLNLDAFREKSYFHDGRFLRSFETLAAWLKERGMLRVTTLLIGGVVAAVDMGAVRDSDYTVLAGGTSPEFPGVAKMINLRHIEWACQEKFKSVDFLCGDFGWKERFHLEPRPLYVIEKLSRASAGGDPEKAP